MNTCVTRMLHHHRSLYITDNVVVLSGLCSLGCIMHCRGQKKGHYCCTPKLFTKSYIRTLGLNSYPVHLNFAVTGYSLYQFQESVFTLQQYKLFFTFQLQRGARGWHMRVHTLFMGSLSRLCHPTLVSLEISMQTTFFLIFMQISHAFVSITSTK